MTTTSFLKVSQERAIATYEAALLTRLVDQKMEKLVRQNKGGTFHLAMTGHELIGAAAAKALTPGIDWGFPYYRDRAFAIGLGCSIEELFAAFLARDLPNHSGGRMMPDHYSDKALRIPCQSSVVGSQFLQAAGMAKSANLRKKTEVIYVSAGDGATSQGDFHEMLNVASIHRLPLVVVIQDNGWAISVPTQEQTSGSSVASMARGYAHLDITEVDGCSFPEIDTALSQAVKKARMREGPSLIVAKVPRIAAHSSSDDPKKYKTGKEILRDKELDPIPRMEGFLVKEGLASKETLLERQTILRAEVEEAAKAAEGYPEPKESLMEVFAPFNQTHITGSTSSESIVLMDALNHALQEEMERDAGVVVFGQDVAKGKGGVFGITRNLTDRFGEDRCFNTPLAESTIVAMALGLSLDGHHKPVAEIQFADYSWTGINQLFNELSSFYFRSNGQWNCPVVIRMPYGGYIQGGPYHSQSIEAFLCHCPGLKVVVPSNAADAKGLLKTAIRDPNPVIFLEHKALYRQRLFAARQEPCKEALFPFGKASIVHEGEDVTLITWGMGTLFAHEVAQELKKENRSIEVLDLRTLNPLDMEAILTSVKKTGKALIVHEAVKTCGFGAEIAARITDEAFSYLDAPIRRVAAKDFPVPYSKTLENAVLPQMKDVLQETRALALF